MICIDHITYSTTSTIILQNVCFQCLPGKITIILGANGAGKSTLIQIIAGDLQPTQGKITFNQRNLKQWSTLDLARQRAVMQQNIGVAFPFCVYDVVLLGRSPYNIAGTENKRDHEIVCSALDVTGIKHLAVRQYNTLSGGEQQRVQFARALAQTWLTQASPKPCFLLLDEPVSKLDLAEQLRMMAYLKNLKDLGYGIVAILHDLNLATHYADYILLLKNGQQIGFGPVAQICTQAMMETTFGITTTIIDHPLTKKPLLIPHYKQTL